MKKALRIFCLFSLLTICIVIYCFSNQNAEASSRVSDEVQNRLQQIELLNFLFEYITVRKLAHIALYFALGFILGCSAYLFQIEDVLLYATVTSFFYACTDELHQYFILGRCSSYRDVTLDTISALCGVLVIIVLVKLLLCVRKLISRTHSSK